MLIMSDTFSAGPLSGTSDGYNLKRTRISMLVVTIIFTAST